MGGSALLFASASSTLGGLVFGYQLAVISGALLQLKSQFGLSCIQQELLVSSLLAGALLASLLGGSLIDRYGCRKSILLSIVLMLTGTLLLLVSSYQSLLLGRLTVGFAMCQSSMSCCIFVSEMVSPERRGRLVTLYEAGITAGVLFAYTVNYLLVHVQSGWKWMFAVAAVPTLIQLVSVCALPSPASLPSQTTLTAGDEARSNGKKAQCDISYLFRRRDNMRTRTALGLGLVLFQQLTGQPNVLFYASTIFHSAGFHSDNSAVLATVGIGIVKVAATLVSVAYSDKWGRRPLLIGGCCVMAFCLICVGLLGAHPLNRGGAAPAAPARPCGWGRSVGNHTGPLLHLPAGNDTALLGARLPETQTERAATESSPSVGDRVLNWIIVVCMMAAVSAYSIGFGPMTWLLLSEIFPAAVRGRAFAFTSCFNWSAHLLVAFTFLDLFNALGLSGTFLMYGMMSAAAALFFYFMLPETKGKTLEEIDRELRLNRFHHRTVDCCDLIRQRTSPSDYQRVVCQ
ncbi:solute carrier family 2, facilitated glucose transporter member 10 [Syngnathus acus]|uniref:solute carrier family 2, facilitated glucose transporter member 10 n=1 Tax=Syngnathus acus TaxID=161584 RepID=UPI0018860D05|nr:solute carrier family 2, facilitated glucose transporter member 10 [Syngnathus acus]XP_037106793.1 solute carrier family 2, facilitated glucose transporter member 10 [Syngnathus acus]